MIGPHPKDNVLTQTNDFNRTWKVWIDDLTRQANFGDVPSPDTDISAAIGIRRTSTLMRIRSATAGDTTITANPQISGAEDGEVLKLEGLDDIRTVTMNTGNGIVLKGASPIVIGNNIVIQFHYSASKNLWIEDFRNT